MTSLIAREIRTPSLALALAASLVTLAPLPAQAQDAVEPGAPLSLEQYLSQVRGGNKGVQGDLRSGEGGQQRSEEAQLLLAPTFFANTQYTADSKPTQIPLITYDREYTESSSFGFSKLTTFGLQAKLYYSVTYLEWSNPEIFNFLSYPNFSITKVGSIPGSFFNATTLELTQSLWSNGFGRSTRATQEAQEAQALASSHSARYAVRVSLSDAETSYWRLAVARQTIAIQQGVLERARKISEWNERRARLQLADQADALQAEASLKLRELDLQTALDNEKTAERAFNTARGIEGDDVPERLAEVTPELIDSLPVPRKAPLREDVIAAQQQSRAAVANAEIALEVENPTLDVFGSISLNGVGSPLSGKPGGLGDAFAQSVSLDTPTETIGLRFSFPINFGVTSRAREGWRLERDAAELTYQRKLFEQEQDWQDLTDKLGQARRRLQLARAIETAQEAKLMHEKERLQQGRTTTFQVLAFEQDYATSELTRIQAESDVLNLVAQTKLYGDESP